MKQKIEGLKCEMHMKAVGIVICNYNKHEYICKCVQSIIDSSYKEVDIYVVDNASTDNSVELLRREYNDRIEIIENPENIGGSGGFHVGLVKALEKEYKYVMCVDNDVIMGKDNISELFYYMEEHPEVAMVGSRVMIMDQPERIQAMGAKICFQTYTFKDNYRNYIFDNSTPIEVECDYVPACSMMVRTNAINKVGLLPSDTFIYWDDIEWGYRFKLAGYKIICYSKAVVWHKGNFRNISTFGKYYMWRNRIAFFTKYLSDEELDDFGDTILSELFQMIYACNYKGEFNIIKTLMYAYDDALHGIRGKADEEKIFEREKIANKTDVFIHSTESIVLKFNGDYEALAEISNHIRSVNLNSEITVLVDKAIKKKVQNHFPKLSVIDKLDEVNIMSLTICKHIFDVKEFEPGIMYIDKWCNFIENEADFRYCSQFSESKKLFISMRRPVLIFCMGKLRQVYRDAGILMGVDIIRDCKVV